jgi:uncharacterized protein with HEPN domain
MQPDERDRALLWDMHEYSYEATLISAGLTFDTAKDVREVVYSLRYVVFAIEEAANHVSAAFQEAHPEIAWAKIIGMRNILAHDYRGTQDDTVWDAATRGAAELLVLLGPLIGEGHPKD